MVIGKILCYLSKCDRKKREKKCAAEKIKLEKELQSNDIDRNVRGEINSQDTELLNYDEETSDDEKPHCYKDDEFDWTTGPILGLW